VGAVTQQLLASALARGPQKSGLSTLRVGSKSFGSAAETPAGAAETPAGGAVLRDDGAHAKAALPRSSSSPCLGNSPQAASVLLAELDAAPAAPAALEPVNRLAKTRGSRRLLEVRRRARRAARARALGAASRRVILLR
jgi:hypothetical protein